MTFSLFDEDDEENQRAMRERFMGPSVGGGGGEYDLGRPDPMLDPQLAQTFLSQRPMTMDEVAPYPIPVRDEPSSLGSDISGALMGLGDIFANKGRNVGAITAGMVKARANDRELSDQRFENDRKAYLLQGEGDARKRQLELQGRNADMRALEIDAQRKRDADIHTRFLMGQDSPEAKAAEVEHKAALAALARAQAAQQTPGEDGLTSEQRERGKDRDADRDARGQIAADNNASRELQKRIAAQAAADAAADRNRIQQDKTDTRDTTSFLDKTIAPRAQGKRLQGIEPIINKAEYKDDLPGKGLIESHFPAWANPENWGNSQRRQDADAIQKLHGEATDYFNLAITGAAGTPKERELRNNLKALNGTEEEFRAAIKYWQDDVRGQLRGRATAAPRVARAALDAEGLGEWSGVPEYVEPAPVPQQSALDDLPPMGPRDPRAIDAGAARPYQPSGGNNYGFGDLPNDTLPVTGDRRRDIPPIPLDAEERLKQRGVIFR